MENQSPDCRLTDVATLADLLQTLPAGEVTLLVSGESMVPFYLHRETVVTLRREVGYRLRRGDAVLFLRTDGTPVLHRVLRVGSDRLLMGGDGQRWVEWIAHEQVLARVVRVRRRQAGRTVSVDALWYRCLVGLWSCGRFWHPRVAKWCRTRCRTRCRTQRTEGRGDRGIPVD